MAKAPKANKELGQHYLKDKSVIQKIAAQVPADADAIMEVGPGPGALTRPLSELGKPLYLIEMDRRFEQLLEELPNVQHIYFQDALSFDWNDFLHQSGLVNKKIWMVSNLPYNVSSQLFVQFAQIKQIEHMTLMYQKEVGEKTYLRDGVKNQNNSLLSLSRAFFDSKLLVKVSPGAFLPPPRVDSVVVDYSRKQEPDVALERFSLYEGFLRHIFSFKRKQLGSVLKSRPEYSALLELLKDRGFDLKKRAESLEREEVLGLFELFCEIEK